MSLRLPSKIQIHILLEMSHLKLSNKSAAADGIKDFSYMFFLVRALSYASLTEASQRLNEEDGQEN